MSSCWIGIYSIDRPRFLCIKTIGTLDRKSVVVVLSANSDHQQPALDAGADAFVNISDPPRVLLAVINNLFEVNTSLYVGRNPYRKISMMGFIEKEAGIHVIVYPSVLSNVIS